MRYVQYLINQARAQTENESFSDFEGIKDSEFLQYINDAQHHLQSLIVAQHPNIFLEEYVVSISSGQDTYTLPSDAFLSNKVNNVEYSSTGSEDDYYILEETSLKRRNSGVDGAPSKYIRMSGKIILNTTPSTGKLRITYVKRLNELDLRVAKIASYSAGTITLENTTLVTDTTSLSEHDYICIVDSDGDIKHKNVTKTSQASNGASIGIDTSTITGTPSANQYIVGGKDTSTHSDLPRNVERYLIAYCAWKILKRDSSVDSAEMVQELSQMANDIVKSYSMISDDVQFVPQLNNWDDWSN